jgi:hypothetical protein
MKHHYDIEKYKVEQGEEGDGNEKKCEKLKQKYDKFKEKLEQNKFFADGKITSINDLPN